MANLLWAVNSIKNYSFRKLALVGVVDVDQLVMKRSRMIRIQGKHCSDLFASFTLKCEISTEREKSV